MHGYSRLGNPRAAGSPPSSPRCRHGRNKNAGGRGPKQSIVEKVVVLLISVVFKRRGVLLFAPLLYISGMLLYMGSVSFDVVSLKNAVVVVSKRSPPGSLYRSPQVFQKLWPYMQAESNHTHNFLMTVWNSKVHQVWKPCISKDTPKEALPQSNGLFIIEANGGLNQQRLSICDAVAVAGLLNATLLIPIFHLNSVWRDSSHFGNIFDEDFFIHALRNHVNVVRELPGPPKVGENGGCAHCTFFEQIGSGSSFKSPTAGGKYVSVHLRFEEDMVAFSCCEYDGGEEEKREMDIARERGWRGKFRRRGRVIRPGANRVDGKCPLTPLEVGMMLRGMGFDNTTSVYIAAGKIYKAEKYMAPLKQMFPRLEMKDTLATAEELAPFQGHLSRLAALDYTVCLHSEVFVTTQGGNFPHFLMGHRRYLYGGHSKTINPDKRKLALLFDNPSIRWEDFKRQVRDMLRHSDQKGVELKKPSASLYTFPMPDCMCKEAEARNENSNMTNKTDFNT
ncbi:hypothetical protein L3X38_008919 [Prunus dulcis]|uniref:O-fucosyltransferase family protein n=1 Tax=Prunus dulcis TaxID=3755 RepID=A0AAD4ZXE7_PRUDU|nr:hypothetical protein L3X38_008919 [Prunus dulcis]